MVQDSLTGTALRARAAFHFWVPQLLVVAAAAGKLTPLSVLLLLLIPLLVEREWLLANWSGLSLINFALYAPEASWIGLLPSYYFLLVAIVRFGWQPPASVIRRECRLEIAGLAIIVASFVMVTWGHYYVLTGVKSSLQLGFLLMLSAVLRTLDPAWFVTFRRQMLEVLPAYIVMYGALTFAIWQGSEDRYGGMLGAQVLAFALAVLFAFYWYADRRAAAMSCLFGLVLTGSRTYVAAAVLVIALPLIAGRFRVNRVATIIALIALCALGAYLLPMLSERFVFADDDFYGSLLGRLVNYDAAIDHFKAFPVFGQGMGAMLRVLENWIPEYFEIYRVTGDTTIMHNEYLRVLVETGLIGGIVGSGFIRRGIRAPSIAARAIVVVMLVGSFTENTLSAYSCTMVLFSLFVRCETLLGKGSQ